MGFDDSKQDGAAISTQGAGPPTIHQAPASIGTRELWRKPAQGKKSKSGHRLKPASKGAQVIDYTRRGRYCEKTP
jgi:hypothetical protein